MLSYPLTSRAVSRGAARRGGDVSAVPSAGAHATGRRHGDQREPWRVALDRDDPAGPSQPPASRRDGGADRADGSAGERRSCAMILDILGQRVIRRGRSLAAEP